MEVVSPLAAMQASSSLLAMLASNSDTCAGIVRGVHHCRFFRAWVTVLDDYDLDSGRMVIDAGGLGV
jgi:hypothetical protein